MGCAGVTEAMSAAIAGGTEAEEKEPGGEEKSKAVFSGATVRTRPRELASSCERSVASLSSVCCWAISRLSALCDGWCLDLQRKSGEPVSLEEDKLELIIEVEAGEGDKPYELTFSLCAPDPKVVSPKLSTLETDGGRCLSAPDSLETTSDPIEGGAPSSLDEANMMSCKPKESGARPFSEDWGRSLPDGRDSEASAILFILSSLLPMALLNWRVLAKLIGAELREEGLV
jgi:hypothetical protein